MSDHNTLVVLTELDRMLAEVTHIDEAITIRSKLDALQIFARNIGESQATINEIVAARLKSERRAGQLLLDMTGAQGKRTDLTSSALEEVALKQSLKETGLSYQKISDWRCVAAIPDTEFENLLADRIFQNREIYTADFVRAGARYLCIDRDGRIQKVPEQREKKNLLHNILHLYYEDKIIRAVLDNNPIEARKLMDDCLNELFGAIK